MNRKLLIGIAIAVIVIAGVLYLRSRRAASADSDAVAPGGSTDLNSVAPELIGGPSGPNITPAVSLPVNITLTEQASQAPPPKVIGPPMESGERQDVVNPVQRQRQGEPATKDSEGVVYPDESGLPQLSEGT